MAATLLALIVAVYASVATAYIEARRRREAAPRWARIAGPLGVVLHFAGLSLLSAQFGRSPFGTTSEALSFLAFALIALYLVLELVTRIASHGGSFYWLATLLTAVAVPGVIENAQVAPTDTPADSLRTYHVGLGLLSTAAVLVSGLLGAAYLNAYRRVKLGDIRHGIRGFSLSGFQRLAKSASLLGVVLLVPSLVIGIELTTSDGAPKGLLLLTLLTAILLALLAVAWLIWWRRPLRGKTAALVNVAAAVLVLVAIVVVHPLVIRGAA
ncbi:MAG: hypothetical protein QNJ98_19795 [Planctomycetota bacterium]|nr:hypothetical protein [Planctomycetota bacterium]